MATITHDLRATLNEREQAIYSLLCDNKTNAQIARELSMSTSAVCWNLSNIYRKLGLDVSSKDGLQSVRRQAILYSGTTIEQHIGYTGKETGYSIKQIRTAAKCAGLSLRVVDDLISFLEME